MDTQTNNNKTNLVIKRQVQAEAISKAVYMVTDLFDNDEPLKISLRKSAIKCIENKDNKDSILELISLIRLSKDLNLITEMNANVLLKALEHRLAYIGNANIKEEEINSVDISNILHKDDTEIHEERKEDDNVIHIHQKDISVFDKDRKVTTPSMVIHNSTHNIKTINNISMDIGSRRKKIMEIVKSRGSVTINEFIESIKGCSSKTIQRELTSLVLSGNLKKTGERRWSKYSLK